MTLVSCPDRFFLCFGKRVWCNSNSSLVLNPQILEIVLKDRKQAANNEINYVFLFFAPGSVFTMSSEPLQQVIETCKKLVRGLFSALQTISRIWGFRAKLLLELHQTLFPIQNTGKSGLGTRLFRYQAKSRGPRVQFPAGTFLLLFFPWARNFRPCRGGSRI